jgi:alpha-mannosidase
VRLVELDGKPQADVRVLFAAPISAAREVNGQEQPIGEAKVNDGVLITSFSAYQPRTFALRLTSPVDKLAGVQSEPVALHYDLATASNDGTRSQGGFDGKGNTLPAEMLPSQITFNDVKFQLAPAKTGSLNAVTAKGQSIALPSGHYNRVYLLAAADGDQKATFELANRKVELNIQNWGGFIGQWDDRQWSSKNTSHDDYGDMIGLKPGYIKRADLAWFCSHHHNAAGENITYSYSYLFGYSLDLPEGVKTIRLPNNEKIRILAISVANKSPEMTPAQPLYDVLPSSHAGPADFTVMASTPEVSVPQGRSATNRVMVLPRGDFNGEANLSVSGLPAGVTASFNPASTTGSSAMTLTASNAAAPVTTTATITATSGNLSHNLTSNITVTPVLSGTVPVDLSPVYNITGIYSDNTRFERDASFDGGGYSFSEQQIGREQVGDSVVFRLGPANAPDVVTGKTVSLPAEKFSSLKILATAVEGEQEMQIFTVTYSDGTSSSFTQSLSDWAYPQAYKGESVAASMPYRLAGDGSKDSSTFHVYAYSFNLDSSKSVRSVSLPSNREVLILAMTLVPAKQ